MSVEGEELNPVEKMRIRVAAEGYHGYKALDEDAADGDENHASKQQLSNDAKSGSTARSCSSFDKLVTALLALALVIIVALSILLAVQGHLLSDKDSKACVSAECVEISAAVLGRMDLTVEPCDDFYQYACGRFENDPQNPPEEPKYSMFALMSRRNKALVKKLLDDADDVEYMGRKSSAVEKLKRYYSVCMNRTATEQTGVEAMLQLISDVGSWTVTSDNISGTWSEADFDLERTLAKLHSYGTMVLFDFGIEQDLKNSSSLVLSLDQGGLTFSDYTHYTGNETGKYRDAYVDYFSQVALLLGGSDADSRRLAQDVWQFEVSLSKIMDKPEDRVDTRKMYHKMTVHDLQNIIDVSGGQLNLADYLHEMFNKDIAGTATVVVYSTNFFGNLTAVINNATTETLANYLTFGIVQSMMSYLPEKFQAPDRKLDQVLIGISEQRAHWLTCTSRATGTLGFAAGALYVDKYFTEEDKHKVNNLLDHIIAEFDSNLKQVSWMDGKTRQMAEEKLDAMNRKIGYPRFIKDVDKLDAHYDKLTVQDTNSFENALLARKFGVQFELSKYGTPPDKKEWHMVPTEVNAYYSRSMNEMVFPAGILASPFYSSAFSAAMNFGSMGFIMGHELTHGFDNKGRLMDKDGLLENWWTNKSAEEFEKKAQCLIDQYSGYKVGDTHLNGVTTQGENIADNGGLKTSFGAYRKWLKAHHYRDKNSKLPALHLSHNQLFFLAFAQTWCTSITAEYEKAAVTTDPHSNARYRVRGVLSNSADFAEAYGCKKGSNMNPKHKCEVW